MELNHLSFVMRGLDPRIQLFAKKMDRRVKPGQAAMTIENQFE
jgi:hypothetical protein